MNEITTFGSWLKRRRKSLDLTQKDLAEQIGCSVAAIQKIEAEERRPSRQIADLLAEVLKIPHDERKTFIKVARGNRLTENLSQPVGSIPPLDEIQGIKPVSKLPVPTTPLVGREAEMEAIARSLREPDCRLLTIVGEGGIGKTRLCLEVARQFASGDGDFFPFMDGMYFIALAPITASEHILSAMAQGIGFSFSGQTDEETQFLSFLHDKQMLLVLDNMEHLLHSARPELSQLISGILSGAPGVKVLATSRERLNLQEEWGFEVGGLSYPLTSQNDTHSIFDVPGDALPRLEEFSAVKLFIQSVRRRDAKFQLTPENNAAVLRICHLVNGMPLGIELAAGWTSTLTCEEIAQEIANGLDFLSTPVYNIPERHRSIRAAFDHSWKLLTVIEQAVLARLSVFQGGFRRAAAERVAGANITILSTLIDKSLVHRSLAGRYDLHELVRQYAGDHLQEHPDVYEETLNCHSRYYLSYLEDQFPSLRNQEQKDALVELMTEIDNLRQAWNWASRRKQVQDLQRVTVPFMVYHELRNLFREGESMFQQTLDMVQNIPTDREMEIVRADLTAQRAWFGFRLGKMSEALDQLRECISILRKHAVPILLAEVLWYYAFACWFTGAFEEALQVTQEGIDLNSQLNRWWQVAIIRFIRGGALHDMDSYEAADQELREAVRLCRKTGDPRIISVSISMLCRNRQAMNELGGMKEILQEGLQLATETGDRYGMGMALEQLGLMAQVSGDYEEARRLFLNSIQLLKEIGDLWSLSRSYNSLGKYYLDTGEIEEAIRSFRESFRSAMTGRALAYAMEALASLAILHQKHGEPGMAFRYASFVHGNLSSPMGIRERIDTLLQELIGQMSPEEVQRAASSPITFESLTAELING